ncbi:hypothetical protein ACJ41O_001824 [Fusarium nematophilum]
MCKWDIFLFKCGCFQVKLKEFCHDRRIKYHLDCVEIQQVRKEWVYRQDGACDPCKKRQAEGGLAATEAVPDWRDLERAAYQIARDNANRGRFD